MSKDRRTVSVEPDVNQYLARDGVNASELVESLVREHMRVGDKHTVALEVQIRHKKREAENAKERYERLLDEIGELRELQDEFETDSDELEDTLQALKGTPADMTNEAIMNHADRLGITPQELVRELREYREQ